MCFFARTYKRATQFMASKFYFHFEPLSKSMSCEVIRLVVGGVDHASYGLCEMSQPCAAPSMGLFSVAISHTLAE